MIYFLLGLGLVLLVFGSNFFVEYVVRIAKRLQISVVAFSAVVVAIGTSLPELVVTIDAGIKQFPEIIIGNIIGSNIANVGLVLAVALLLSKIRLDPEKVHRQGELLLLLSLIFASLLYLGIFTWIFGLIFLVISGFIANDLLHKREALPIELVELERRNLPVNIMILLGSLAAVLFGADMVVDSATQIATSLNISLGFIAASLIAVGTSLPELTVTIASVKKDEEEVAVGNIIGSNLFNIALVGGIGSLFSGLHDSFGFTYGFFFLIFAFAVYLLAVGRIKSSRFLGILLLLLYVLFIAFSYFSK